MKRIAFCVLAVLMLLTLVGCNAPQAPAQPPATRPVPAFVGMAAYEIAEQEEYEQWKAWFTFAEYVQADSDEPAGTVLSQTPAAGTAAVQGTVITLTVSREQAAGTVPAVSGLTLEKAAVALEKAGYVVKLDPVPHDTVEAGIVLEVSFEGEAAPAGTEITVTYSAGPAEEEREE